MKGAKRTPTFLCVTFYALLGPVVWSLHFGAIYGALHVWCEIRVGSDGGVAKFAIAAATLLALALLACGAKFLGGRIIDPAAVADETKGFLHGTMKALALLSALAIVWAGAAAFFLPECAALR